jgi:NitT/TauT family transport system permease protein
MATTVSFSAQAPSIRSLGKRQRLFLAAVGRPSVRRSMMAMVAFVVLWQIGSTWHHWSGIRLPWIGAVPAPTEVFAAWFGLLGQWGYWESWYLSFMRVLSGFAAAMLLGIPLGLGMAVNRVFYDFTFPPFEILRPIPPLAWVPASLIFWPTQELSIAFVTFLGAFFAIVINVVGGAKSIDVRFLRAARSMGATRWHLFWRVVLPGTLPSIFVGAAVGMGITWEVVVAAEMISTGGRGGGGGLGFFIWNSYLGGSLPQIVVGMISIGIAGFISSALIRRLGKVCMPWRSLF